MQKFLVIQTAFIGDVVLATGIIEKLHAVYPGAQIDFLVRKGNEALLAGHPWLRRTLVWDKKKGKLKNLWKMLRLIRQEHYDTVINVQRFAATGILTAFSGAKQTIGFDKNPLSRLFTRRIPHVVWQAAGAGKMGEGHAGGAGKVPVTLHEIERNNALIEPLTGPGAAARPRLYPTEADFEAVAKYKKGNYITIGPASVWFTKQYPKDKWIHFIDQLPADYTVFLLGGPGDKELCREIRDTSLHPDTVDLSGSLSFLRSAALMQGARMNYVNDSAPMHFASAMNAPVTAVYCSTLPSFGFGPLSDKSFVVEVREQLPCRPCGLHGRKVCPLGHFHCAYKIMDGQLLETLG